MILINVFFVFNFPKNNFSGGEIQDPNRDLYSQTAYVFPISEPSYLPILNTSVEPPILSAKSAVAYDTRSARFLFSKNSGARLPIASLTKLLNAVVVAENFSLDEVTQITKESIKVDGEKQTLYLDENISIGNLMKIMLIESSNDAAYALKYYVEKSGTNLAILMNKKAVELGMGQSIFKDPAGLNDDALSSAEDLVKLIRYSLKFDDLWRTMAEKNSIVNSVDGKISHQIKSTNQLLGVIPDIIGGKTGYTDEALGCLILVVDVPGKNDKLIVVVLGSLERFTDTEKLVDWIRRAYSWE